MKAKKQAEPIFVKAGDIRLKLGHNSEPPKVDCRIVAEDYYQRMIKKIEQRDELLEASKALINHMGKDWESNPLLALLYRNKLKAIAKAIKNCK